LDKISYTLDEANRKESLGLWDDKVEVRKMLFSHVNVLRRMPPSWDLHIGEHPLRLIIQKLPIYAEAWVIIRSSIPKNHR
jgi:hypothetical protein